MEKIGIIGSGTWGTAIAVLLKNNGHEVTLWSAIPAEIEEMAKTGPTRISRVSHFRMESSILLIWKQQ